MEEVVPNVLIFFLLRIPNLFPSFYKNEFVLYLADVVQFWRQTVTERTNQAASEHQL